MLTYPLNKESGRSLYEQLYEGIRRDILSGTLPAHQRLPSKRALAQHLEVSIITVQNAYEQLAAEGYIYSQEKRGYYVSPVERPLQAAARQPAPLPPEPEQKTYFLDLVTNSIDRAYFPFTVWARLMRETLLERDKALQLLGFPEMMATVARLNGQQVSDLLGWQKVQAIHAALRGKFVGILITDETTAAGLIEIKD